MINKPRIFFASNVFSVNEIGSNKKISEKYRIIIKKLWQQLDQLSKVKIFNGRFPSEEILERETEKFNPHILGCHLGHKISSRILKNPDLFAISTSTAGYNHIQRTENDNILITHTPGVLHETVADYTIAIIMANLRNLIDLHNYIWNEQWVFDNKWDLDQSLSSVISDKTLGIVGLGEIGKELVKRIHSWGIKILYHDLKQMHEFEKIYPSIEFKQDIKDIFRESDIISLHIPLNEDTKNLINRKLIKLMKEGALLVNTARGGVLDLQVLLEMLENKEIQINFAFDVFPKEPIDPKILERIKTIKKRQPDRRMILLPHNASADANTRAKMIILFLEDIIKIIKSSSLEDLNKIHIIPEHKKQLTEKKWRIFNYWGKK